MSDETPYVLKRDEMLKMVAAMNKYGGSFVQALAECFLRADRENLIRLYATFPEYVKEYREMASRFPEKL